MRLGPDMNHLNTFNLHRNKGGSKWAGGGLYKKRSKNVMNLTKFQLQHHVITVYKMQSRSAFFTVSLDKLTLLLSWIEDGRA